MCGIAGVVHLDRDRPVDRQVVHRMTQALAHRGPDGDGYYLSGNVGLGHRRLAIIDLATGSQPMSSRDGSLVIVFNGEIYNYVELRDELIARGHRFETSSDTEVILSAYTEWGFDCQTRLNGMWAFALWDAPRQQLLLSRDRIGEKPLHVALRDRSLWFGSEIKSLLATGLEYPAATRLMHVYLSLGYVPAPYTFYEGISRLRPGHFLVVKNGTVREDKYWDLPAITEKDMRTDASRVYEEFDACFTDAVRIRMRSDVPYGAFLSGGLDSSSVVAAMSCQSARPVQTFTIGFDERVFDERSLARDVARHHATDHREEVVRPNSLDESLDGVLRQFDEPFGDASAGNVSLVARLARRTVTMVLTGDGGDEVLSGYPMYLWEKLIGSYVLVPEFVRHLVDRMAAASVPLAKRSLRYRLNRLHRFLQLAEQPFDERLAAKLAPVDRASIRQIVAADMPQVPIDDYLAEMFSRCEFRDPFYRLMYFNLKVSLPDDMLAKVDRMTMAHSLEARVPFLDHRLVELMYRVDKAIKMPHLSLKNVLKKTRARQLPKSVRRGSKKSFRVPLREWFKQEQFDHELRELERSELFDRTIVARVIRANNRSEHDYGDFIWRLLVLNKWMRCHTLKLAA